MHMIRLLLAGAHLLRIGQVLVDVRGMRDRLLAVKHGAVPWHTVTAWADDLLADLAAAEAETRLPASPDRGTIDQLLLRVRERNLR
jgi:hypothetical protein